MLDKIFPDHWSFMIGEIALYCFVILVLTGSYLTFFFSPSEQQVIYHGVYKPLQGQTMSDAYRSVIDISFKVRSGLVMRQIHHWAAVVFLAAIVVHLCRIFFTGAFRRPREVNWIIGVTLLLLAMANGFTGYSLPDDLLSGTGLRIAYSIVLSIPFIGSWVGYLVFGGRFPGTDIIQRLFIIHVLFVPALIAIFLTAHLGDPLASETHRLSRPRQDRGHHPRQPVVAAVRGQVDRPVLLHRLRPGRPGRPGPDQPHLDLRPLSAGRGERRVATGLVHRLVGRGAAGHAAT